MIEDVLDDVQLYVEIVEIVKVEVHVLDVQLVELIYLIHVHLVVNDRKHSKITNEKFDRSTILFKKKIIWIHHLWFYNTQ